MAGNNLARVLVLITAAAVAACGGGDDPVGPDASVEPFVGTWQADSLTIGPSGGTVVVDILGAGGSFFITVEASGQYTAALEILGGMASPEIGQLTVINSSTLRLTPTTPPGRPSTVATYVFATPDSLILDGPTEFDVNGDGTLESAEVHFELTRD